MTTPLIRKVPGAADRLERGKAALTNRQIWALDWQRQGLKITAIAEGLSISRSATQKLLARARRKLGLTVAQIEQRARADRTEIDFR
jgi:DNA-binding CsgD family transcriptional regulator